MNLRDTLIKLCQGNPGALNVLIELHKAYGDQFFIPLAIALELTQTKAPNIWIVFKDICNHDLEKTRDYLKDWFEHSSGSLGAWLREKGVEYSYE